MSRPEILTFYSGSFNHAPGNGSGEYVANPSAYKQLSEIMNWRRMLSNFFVAPFVLDGKTYRTVEHYFQSQKLRLVDEALAETFTVESGTSLGTEGTGLDARQMRKAKLLSKDQLSVWTSQKDFVLEKAWRAKFTQTKALHPVLLATNTAELWHCAPHLKPERFIAIETLREEMRHTR